MKLNKLVKLDMLSLILIYIGKFKVDNLGWKRLRIGRFLGWASEYYHAANGGALENKYGFQICLDSNKRKIRAVTFLQPLFSSTYKQKREYLITYKPRASAQFQSFV